MANKGSPFEREICRVLSKWWTKGASDSVFWRVRGSGGRAKVRGRKGLQTVNQDGDVMAVDPVGMPFVRAFTVEIKRGYNKNTVMDLVDAGASAPQELEKWLGQVIESAEQAGTLSYLLIVRRDRRRAVVYFPARTPLSHCFSDYYGPYLRLKSQVRLSRTRNLNVDLICVPLDLFLLAVKSEDVVESFGGIIQKDSPNNGVQV